jgi:hypothetical protein
MAEDKEGFIFSMFEWGLNVFSHIIFRLSQIIFPFCALYCDGYGVCYAMASKIHVTPDVSIASQRLRIPRQPDC